MFDSNKWGLKWSIMIPTIYFDKKSLKKFKKIDEMRKLEKAQVRGTYAQI